MSMAVKRWKIDPSLFELSSLKETIKVSFPDDCPYAGQFFYCSKSNVEILNDGLVIELPMNYEVALFDTKTSTYKEIDWSVLVEQIGRYMRKRNEEKKNEESN